MDRLRILAWIHILIGGGMFLLGLGILAVAATDPNTTRYALTFIGGLFFWLAVLVFLPSLLAGVGLLRRQAWGRLLVTLVSIEWLLLFPIGTIIGGFGLWTILKGPPEPNAAPSPLPARPRPDSGLVRVLGGVALAFLVVVGGGLALSRVVPLGQSFGIAAGIAIFPLAFLFARLLGFAPTRGPRRPAPARVPSAGVPAQPEPLCPHLQPIGQALAVAGLPLRRGNAPCRIHPRSFAQRFAPLGPVAYRETFYPERSEDDNPTGEIRCAQCGGVIRVLHPMECSLETPWFPAAPPTLRPVADRCAGDRQPVNVVATSPSGRYVATCGGELVIWDAVTYTALRRLPGVRALGAMVWTRDERMLITGRGELWAGGSGSAGSCISMWDIATGAEVLRSGEDLCGVRGLAVSPDGRWLLVSGLAGEQRAAGSTLDLLDLATGRRLTRLAHIVPEAASQVPYFTGVTFSPDGAMVYAGLARHHFGQSNQTGQKPPWWWERGVRAWRVSDGQEADWFRGCTAVHTVRISQDGLRLFAAGHRMSMWSLEDGKLLWEVRVRVDTASASPDLRWVARGMGYQVDNHGPYADTAVELYDGRSGELLGIGPHHRPPLALDFAGPGPTLVAGGEEGELRFWSIP